MEKLPIDAALRWCTLNREWADYRVWFHLMDADL